MTIGKRIVEERKRAKLSQESLADKLGISRQTLSNYENDITSPDLVQATAIAELLDISLDELVGNDNPILTKITKTENMVKRQKRSTTIILVTLYFIILTFLIVLTVYFLTKKDFTSEYQTDFKCYNKKAQEYYEVSLESGNVTNKYDNDVEISEVATKFIAVICQSNNKEDGCYEEKMSAGDDISTALDSIQKIKKYLIENGCTCK